MGCTDCPFFFLFVRPLADPCLLRILMRILNIDFRLATYTRVLCMGYVWNPQIEFVVRLEFVISYFWRAWYIDDDPKAEFVILNFIFNLVVFLPDGHSITFVGFTIFIALIFTKYLFRNVLVFFFKYYDTTCKLRSCDDAFIFTYNLLP